MREDCIVTMNKALIYNNKLYICFCFSQNNVIFSQKSEKILALCFDNEFIVRVYQLPVVVAGEVAVLIRSLPIC